VLSSVFVALFQAVAGDPAATAAPETPAAEAPAATPSAAPRTERRRVCDQDAAATGGRLARRRCRYEEVPIEEPTPPEETATQEQSGGAPGAAPAAAPSAEPQ
jgi:hypothetical protein